MLKDDTLRELQEVLTKIKLECNDPYKFTVLTKRETIHLIFQSGLSIKLTGLVASEAPIECQIY